MTKEERKQIRLIEEGNYLLQNAKHWKNWLEQELLLKEDEKSKGKLEVLNWIIANMQEHDNQK